MALSEAALGALKVELAASQQALSRAQAETASARQTADDARAEAATRVAEVGERQGEDEALKAGMQGIPRREVSPFMRRLVGFGELRKMRLSRKLERAA